jgi:hypothetical protein
VYQQPALDLQQLLFGLVAVFEVPVEETILPSQASRPSTMQKPESYSVDPFYLSLNINASCNHTANALFHSPELAPDRNLRVQMDGSVTGALRPAIIHTKHHAAELLPTYTRNMLAHEYSVAVRPVKYRFDTNGQAIEQICAS